MFSCEKHLELLTQLEASSMAKGTEDAPFGSNALFKDVPGVSKNKSTKMPHGSSKVSQFLSKLSGKTKVKYTDLKSLYKTYDDNHSSTLLVRKHICSCVNCLVILQWNLPIGTNRVALILYVICRNMFSRMVNLYVFLYVSCIFLAQIEISLL